MTARVPADIQIGCSGCGKVGMPLVQGYGTLHVVEPTEPVLCAECADEIRKAAKTTDALEGGSRA